MDTLLFITSCFCFLRLLCGHAQNGDLNVSIDVGRSHPFVLLEHININTGGAWNEQLSAFYFDALGFVSDPRSEQALQRTRGAGGVTNGLLWANTGLQQIHFPFDEAQRVRGHIGLEYENLDIVMARLEVANISYSIHATNNSAERFLETSCPIGNRFRIHQQQHLNRSSIDDHVDGHAAYSTNMDGTAIMDAEVTPSWLGPLPEIPPSSLFELPGGRSLGLGISYINFDCPHDTAQKICRFYEYFFGVNSTHVVVDGTAQTPGCVVPIGFRQHLRFTELSLFAHAASQEGDGDNNDVRSSPTSLPPYDGHHIAVYVNDFVEIYSRVAQFNLNWDNPRFPQFTYPNVSKVLKYNEFRIRDIIDLDTNETIYQLEHEIRSLVHPAFCCKSLVVHYASAVE